MIGNLDCQSLAKHRGYPKQSNNKTNRLRTQQDSKLRLGNMECYEQGNSLPPLNFHMQEFGKTHSLEKHKNCPRRYGSIVDPLGRPYDSNPNQNKMEIYLAGSSYWGARPLHIQDNERLPLRHMSRPIQSGNNLGVCRKLNHNKLGTNNTAIRVQSSKNQFQQLTATDKNKLIKFLESL